MNIYSCIDMFLNVLKEASMNNKRTLLISFLIITTYMLVEVIGGFLTNSLALLSDAGHMLSDSIALGIALLAFVYSERAATKKKTFGYKRFEILAATLNGFTLLAVSLYIFYEAIKRFSNPPEVATTGMLIISVIGLFVNILVAFIMHRNADTENNLNMRGAYLHVISDMLGSIGAIIAALSIIFFGWAWADPLASVLVAILVLRSGYKVSKSSLSILMESTPEHVNLEEIIELIKKHKKVINVHDLHVWTITSNFHALTAHIVVDQRMKVFEVDHLREEITKELEHLDIQHITLQFEARHAHDEQILCTHEVDLSDSHGHHHH